VKGEDVGERKPIKEMEEGRKKRRKEEEKKESEEIEEEMKIASKESVNSKSKVGIEKSKASKAGVASAWHEMTAAWRRRYQRKLAVLEDYLEACPMGAGAAGGGGWWCPVPLPLHATPSV